MRSSSLASSMQHIVRRIFFDGIYLENIGIGKQSLDFLHDNFIIAFFQVADAAVDIVLPAAGVECDKCLCHSRNCLTDAKVACFALTPVIDFSQIIIEFTNVSPVKKRITASLNFLGCLLATK